MIFWKEKWNSWNEDWSEHVPSPDQSRIISHLKTIQNKNILHVGIGNSSFAVEIEKTNNIDGITVIQAEISKAKQIKEQYNLSNYKFWLCDKYSLQILDLPQKYDYIVDNNIFSFSNCNVCKHNILFLFLKLLTQNGEILTDTVGLHYKTNFTIKELENFIIDHNIPLTINRHDDYIIGLKRSI